MMKTRLIKLWLTTTLLIIASVGAFAQTTPTTKTRDGASFTQVDSYVNVLKRFGIPTSSTDDLDPATTLTDSKNQIKLLFNTTLNKLRVYDPIASAWKDATPIDLSNYYTKAQVDALMALKVDKTTTINGKPLS